MTHEPPPDLLEALRSKLDLHRERFCERFGGRPGDVRGIWSPGRVNLMGAHLDYSLGPVLPSSIDRGTFLGLRPRSDGRIRLASTRDDATFEADLAHLPSQALGAWSDYPLGVVLRLLERQREAGGPAPTEGLDVYFGGDLPVGAGLSSSASICVGTAFGLGAHFGFELEARDHVDAALWAERGFVGVQCGIMDPFAVRLTRPGHLLWVDCKDESVEHLPLDADRARIVVADTGVRRALAAGEFNRRVAQCAEAFDHLGPLVEGAVCLRDIPLEVVEQERPRLSREAGLRALHVAHEVRRTFEARSALNTGDLVGFGRCITEAHASLRDLYEVSIPELDLLVETAAGWEGCYGTRLTGAGFGGCIVALVDADALDGFAAHLARSFEARFDHTPEVQFFRGGGGPLELGVG